MSITVLVIVAMIEIVLFFTHRVTVADSVTVADTLREMEARQATARSYSRPVPYQAAPFEWTERASDDRRAVIGSRADVGAVWNLDPKVTR